MAINYKMATEYTIVNTSNKTMFEIGKHILLPDDRSILLYRETLIVFVLNYFNDIYLMMNDEYHIQGYTKLASDIFDFVEGVDPEKEIELANDCDDSLLNHRMNGCIFIGSNFYIEPGLDLDRYLKARNIKSKVDVSKLDFSLPIKRIKKQLILL